MTVFRFISSAAVIVAGLPALFMIPLYPLLQSKPAAWICALAFAFAAVEAAWALYANLWQVLRGKKSPDPAAVPVVDARGVKTILIVPAQLLDEVTIERLLCALEGHYRSNTEGLLYFGLLTDFADAATEVTARDDDLVTRAMTGIDRLNRKYRPDGAGRFFLAHRPRCWSPAQGVWMGYERKRGRLIDFNRLLSTGDATAFSACAGPVDDLVGARFVITLDDDNELPNEGARRLIQHMLSANNIPVIDEKRRVVIAGHAILQPAVTVKEPSRGMTYYQLLQLAGTNEGPSIDIAYQDQFGEAAYYGKAIYCVKTFQALIDHRFPPDLVLSHDPLEACYLRCGWVSDVEAREDVPRTLPTSMARVHRWTRGDWQLLPWIGSRTPRADGAGTEPNPLSTFSRFKLLDNIRHTLVPCALVVLVAAGLTLPGLEDYIVSWAAVLCAAPYLFAMAVRLGESIIRGGFCRRLRQMLRCVPADAVRVFLNVATLPTLAWIAFSAISLSLWRMFISGRNLLEWESTAALERCSIAPIRLHILAFSANVYCSIVLFAANPYLSPTAHAVALITASIWLCPPLLSWWLAKCSAEPTKEPAWDEPSQDP
jgi:cyclic beta-1,2-glucan glucanotransferase